MDENKGRSMDERSDGLGNRRTERWVRGWRGGMGRWVGGWEDGWVNGRRERRLDGEVDWHVNVFLVTSMLVFSHQDFCHFFFKSHLLKKHGK
jgi:hypothetical protein